MENNLSVVPPAELAATGVYDRMSAREMVTYYGKLYGLRGDGLKARLHDLQMPDDVPAYVAARIDSNIRELEGSLIRLIAYASLTGQEISLDLAHNVLRNVIEQDTRVVTIEGIQRFVADHYQLKVHDLKSRNNSKSVAMPRQVAMYLCKALTPASLPEIGRSFGGKHHSTVIHSVNKIAAQAAKSEELNVLLNRFMQEIQ